MKKLFSLSSALIIVTILVSCDSVKTSNQGELSGEVKIKTIKTAVNGQNMGEILFTNIIDSIKVILINENNKRIYTTYTIDGKFKFNELPDGSFTAVAHITDKIELKSNTIDIFGGESLSFNTITFDKYESNTANLTISNGYPLPFTEEVILRLTMNQVDTMNVSIFNLKGDLVADIFQNKFMQAGSSEINCNKIDKDGIYFMYLETKHEYAFGVMVRKIN